MNNVFLNLINSVGRPKPLSIQRISLLIWLIDQLLHVKVDTDLDLKLMNLGTENVKNVKKTA